MLLITITNWKHKLLVSLKLFLFLLLIGLIIPQFLTFIAGEIQPPAIKVEHERESAREKIFLDWSWQFHHGEETGYVQDRE